MSTSATEQVAVPGTEVVRNTEVVTVTSYGVRWRSRRKPKYPDLYLAERESQATTPEFKDLDLMGQEAAQDYAYRHPGISEYHHPSDVVVVRQRITKTSTLEDSFKLPGR